MIDSLRQDVRVALRGFRRSPAFVATTLATLAISIGMAAAMFTVVQAILVTRLPVVDQSRIITLSLKRKDGVAVNTFGDDINQLRRDATTVSAVAASYKSGAWVAPLLDGDRAILQNRGVVSGNFFDVIGARPALGRLLRPGDDADGNFVRSWPVGGIEPVVLSHRSWQAAFGGDSAVIGRHLTDGYGAHPYVIVGVAPAGLDFPVGADFWVPMGLDAGSNVVARLRPNATPAAARSELSAILKRVDPEINRTLAQAIVSPFADDVVGAVRAALGVVAAAVALLLLIACVNVGGLFLLRAISRAHELSIRRAIGAGYGNVVRQLFVESLLLAVGGGLLGLAVADALLRLLVGSGVAHLPRTDVVSLTWTPALAAVGVTGIAVLLFGLVPALLSAQTDLASQLRFDSRTGAQTLTARRFRQSLVASQIALAVVMLAGAGLLATSLERQEHLELGYRPDHLSFITLTFPTDVYQDQAKDIIPLGQAVLSRLSTVPGVRSVTPVLIPPFLGANVWERRFDAERQSAADLEQNPWIPFEGGDGNLFRTLGIALLRGRAFTDADGAGSALVAVVSQSVATRFWPGQDPIGKRVRMTPWKTMPGGEAWRTVIGVVPDLHFRAFRESSPTVFLPWRQSVWQGCMGVRTTGDLATVLPAMQRAVHAFDPRVMISQARPMDAFLDAPLATPRLSAFLLAAFGLVALLLAAIGLYGAMASLVRQQAREMGIRMVLGATPSRLQSEVIRGALVVAAIGVAVGVVGALASSRAIGALLFGVSPTDPLVLSGACAVLVAVSLVAAWLPARRIMRIDPVKALRTE